VKKWPKFTFFILIFTLFILFIYKQTLLPSELKEDVQRLKQESINTQKNIKSFKAKYKTVSHDEKLKAYFPYVAKGDHWEEDFVSSNKYLSLANSSIEGPIAIIVAENSVKDRDTLSSLIASTRDQLNKARLSYLRPFRRLKELKKIVLLSDELTFKRIKAYKELELDRKELSRVVYGSIKEFPKQKKTIKDRLKGLDQNLSTIKKLDTNSNLLLSQLPKEVLQLEKNLKSHDKRTKELHLKYRQFTRALVELPKSFIRILSDIKVVYKVSFMVYSWDRYADNDYEYDTNVDDIEVNEETYNRLLANENKAVGSIISDKAHIALSKGKNEKVEFSTFRVRGDTGEIWLSASSEQYFFKYTLVVDTNQTTTDWMEVDKERFTYHIPHLGMEIASKSVGKFEDPTKEQFAAPAGMHFVNNKYYGKWDNKEWKFNKNYSFLSLLAVPAISYASYKLWDSQYRGKKTYFGQNRSYGTFSNNTYMNPYYRNSYFGSSYYYGNSRYRGRFGSQYNRYNNHGSGYFSYSSGRYYGGGYGGYYDDTRHNSNASRHNRTRNTNYRRSASSSIRSAGASSRGRGPGGGGK